MHCSVHFCAPLPACPQACCHCRPRPWAPPPLQKHHECLLARGGAPRLALQHRRQQCQRPHDLGKSVFPKAEVLKKLYFRPTACTSEPLCRVEHCDRAIDHVIRAPVLHQARCYLRPRPCESRGTLAGANTLRAPFALHDVPQCSYQELRDVAGQPAPALRRHARGDLAPEVRSSQHACWHC